MQRICSGGQTAFGRTKVNLFLVCITIVMGSSFDFSGSWNAHSGNDIGRWPTTAKAILFLILFLEGNLADIHCMNNIHYNINYDKRKEGRTHWNHTSQILMKEVTLLLILFWVHHVIHSNKMYDRTLESKIINPLRTEFRITLNIKMEYGGHRLIQLSGNF